MNKADLPSGTAPATPRLLSLDALRGFDMFWIVGAEELVRGLQKITESGPIGLLADQLRHKAWAGFHFEDLIFPLFVFIVGVSLVFSLTKTLERSGRRQAIVRILLVRLLWGSLIDELITTHDLSAGRNCKPVLLLLDEARRTAIPSLADHATTVVGRGISLWIAIQSLSQLDAIYGKSRATILRDNMESQIYYRPANQETADYLEHSLGRRSDFAHSHTVREGVQTSEGRSEQGIPLLTAQAIKQMRDEDIIGFHRRLPPFKGKRMDWRRFPLLAKRRTIAPPKLSFLPLVEDRVGGTLWQKEREVSYIDPDEIN